ncbi:hypothetical protein V8C42DRAFT_312277 [Trichoderma barbatum]
MGTRYVKLLETSVTCLNDGNQDFGNESETQDENDVLVGVRHIEKATHFTLLF